MRRESSLKARSSPFVKGGVARWRGDGGSGRLPRDDPPGDSRDHLALDSVVAVKGEGVAWVAEALAALDRDQLLHRRRVELLHQRRYVTEEAEAAAVRLVMDDEHGNPH